MLEALFFFILDNWILVSLALVTSWLANNRYSYGLARFPGPFLASLTDWWRFWDVYGRGAQWTHISLHEKHGDVVRLGPNVLSFSDPKALKSIYGLNKGFVKSGFYPVQQALSNGKRLESLFSTTNEAYHAQLRRCVNNAFSMSALIQYEPAVDLITDMFLEQTERLYSNTGKRCDFAEWLQFYAFDVIGNITYSKSHGFVDQATDVDGIIKYLGQLFSYVGPVGQMPFLDLVFLKNPLLRLLDKWNIYQSTFPVVTFAKSRMNERLASMDKKRPLESTRRDSLTLKRADLLSQFLAAQETHSFLTSDRVLTMAVSMAFAGSETTAISLAAIFYFLMKNPVCLKNLLDELVDAENDGRIAPGTKVLSWAESQQLPYMDACIKEAFRLHPAAGLPLERIVPKGGVEIAGHWVPEGTIVGCSAWVIHRQPQVFGENIHDYVPERWLQQDQKAKWSGLLPAGQDGEARRKVMEGTMFQFGMGSRTCIGKNISLLEIYKLVPSFLKTFQVDLEDPQKDWKLHNAWFVKQHEVFVRIHSRDRPSEA